MAVADTPNTTTHDCGVFLLDVPEGWQGVEGADGVRAWADEDLSQHVIVGGYHLPSRAEGPAREALVEELVELELAELARIGAGKVVVRRSQKSGDNAVLAIVTGVDGANSMVFAYYFVVSTSTVVKLKYQRVGLEMSEREVLVCAARLAVTLKIREIYEAEE